MRLSERIQAFADLGSFLKRFIISGEDFESSGTPKEQKEFNKLNFIIGQASLLNPWFRKQDIMFAIHSIANELGKEKIEFWLQNYPHFQEPLNPQKIGVIMAGNIPLAGFFDFFYVLISGNRVLAKSSSQDEILLPFFGEMLIEFNADFKEYIYFVKRLEGFDAVIASGSGNSSRYFEYYFGKVPHIIRKNRNSCAILSGNESEEELQLLGNDIFTYFGAGCRNVSKLYVPENYDFGLFFRPLQSHAKVMLNNRYANNYEYNKAIYLVKLIPFLDNGFLMLRNTPEMAAPRAVLHYEYYSNAEVLGYGLTQKEKENEIQCILAADQFLNVFEKKLLTFGSSQFPGFADYADNVDVMEFLIKIK